MSGKGDKPRPLAISKEAFNNNFDRIFNKEGKNNESTNHSSTTNNNGLQPNTSTSREYGGDK
jgi:hypothetical protein